MFDASAAYFDNDRSTNWSWTSSWCRHRESPWLLSCSVEPTMSVNNTVASTRSLVGLLRGPQTGAKRVTPPRWPGRPVLKGLNVCDDRRDGRPDNQNPNRNRDGRGDQRHRVQFRFHDYLLRSTRSARCSSSIRRSAASIGCADVRSRPNRLSTKATAPSHRSAVST